MANVALLRPMRTDLYVTDSRRFGITTVQRDGAFLATWICCQCGMSEVLSSARSTRDEALELAQERAARHTCVPAPAEPCGS
jgi:hypothetical protein